MNTVTRKLDVLLSDEEVLERATEFAHIDEEIENEEECIRVLSKRSKELITGLRTNKRKLRDAVSKRAEPRDVECYWHPDWHSKQMSLVRMDTGEVVETRTMSPSELQMEFDETLRKKWEAQPFDESEPQPEEPPTGLPTPPMLNRPIDAEWDDDQPQANA